MTGSVPFAYNPLELPMLSLGVLTLISYFIILMSLPHLVPDDKSGALLALETSAVVIAISAFVAMGCAATHKENADVNAFTSWAHGRYGIDLSAFGRSEIKKMFLSPGHTLDTGAGIIELKEVDGGMIMVGDHGFELPQAFNGVC